MATRDLAYYLALKYPAEVQEGPSGGYFVSHPDLDGCMAEGGTLEEAMENLAFSRELWIESRLAGGYLVPEPTLEEELSGKVSLRMSPSLHSRLAKRAAQKDISLNLLINTVLAEYEGGAAQASELSRLVEDFKVIATEIKAATTVRTPAQTQLQEMVQQGADTRTAKFQSDNVLDFYNRSARAAT